MNNNITFDLEKGESREQMIVSLIELGNSKEESVELIDISIDIARSVLSDPKFSWTNQYHRDLLPRLIISQLGAKFTRDERQSIKQNFPQEGGLKLDEIQDEQTRKLMEEFAYSMKEVIQQMVKSHLDRDRQN